MRSFLKANIASCIATLVDFLITMMVFRWLQLGAVTASVIGNLAGGVLHFSISRHFVFKATAGRIDYQVFRYLLIWGGNIFLNMVGVYVLADKCEVHYLLSKIISSLVVFVGFNYPMHRMFVFKTLQRK